MPVPQIVAARTVGRSGAQPSPVQRRHSSCSWSKTHSGLPHIRASSTDQPVPPTTVWSGWMRPTTNTCSLRDTRCQRSCSTRRISVPSLKVRLSRREA